MEMEIKRVTKLDVVRAKSYFLCESGQGEINTRYDGGHKSTAFSPEKYTATTDTFVNICGCNDFKAVACDCAQEEIKHECNC